MSNTIANNPEHPNPTDHFKTIPKSIGSYQIKSLLIRGSHSQVYLGVSEYTGDKVAIKIISKSRLQCNFNEISLTWNEISIWKFVKHINIITLYEILETPNFIFWITELVEGGALIDHIIKTSKLEEKEARKIFQQVMDAMLYLNKNSICHRNIKAESVWIDKQTRVKIINFSYGAFYNKKLNQKWKEETGSPSYACPEMFTDNPYSPELADVWSWGVLWYTMTCGYLPFSEEDYDKNKELIIHGTVKYPDTLSNDWKDLWKGMLTVKPEWRSPFSKIMKHQWVTPGCTSIAGINIYETIYPTDDRILGVLIKFGLNKDTVKKDLDKNKFNSGTGLYKQWVRKVSENGMISNSDFYSSDYSSTVNNNKKKKNTAIQKTFDDFLKRSIQIFSENQKIDNQYQDKEKSAHQELMDLKVKWLKKAEEDAKKKEENKTEEKEEIKAQQDNIVIEHDKVEEKESDNKGEREQHPNINEQEKGRQEWENNCNTNANTNKGSDISNKESSNESTNVSSNNNNNNNNMIQWDEEKPKDINKDAWQNMMMEMDGFNSDIDNDNTKEIKTAPIEIPNKSSNVICEGSNVKDEIKNEEQVNSVEQPNKKQNEEGVNVIRDTESSSKPKEVEIQIKPKEIENQTKPKDIASNDKPNEINIPDEKIVTERPTTNKQKEEKKNGINTEKPEIKTEIVDKEKDIAHVKETVVPISKEEEITSKISKNDNTETTVAASICVSELEMPWVQKDNPKNKLIPVQNINMITTYKYKEREQKIDSFLSANENNKINKSKIAVLKKHKTAKTPAKKKHKWWGNQSKFHKKNGVINQEPPEIKHSFTIANKADVNEEDTKDNYNIKNNNINNNNNNITTIIPKHYSYHINNPTSDNTENKPENKIIRKKTKKDSLIRAIKQNGFNKSLTTSFKRNLSPSPNKPETTKEKEKEKNPKLKSNNDDEEGEGEEENIPINSPFTKYTNYKKEKRTNRHHWRRIPWQG